MSYAIDTNGTAGDGLLKTSLRSRSASVTILLEDNFGTFIQHEKQFIVLPTFSAHGLLHKFTISVNGMGISQCAMMFLRWIPMCNAVWYYHVGWTLLLVIPTSLY